MIKNIKALVFGSFCLFQVAVAQTTAPLVPPITFDPIVATLDSLTTIHNVVKYQAQNTFNTQPGVNVPQFSDAVYADRISKINTTIPLTFNSQVKGYIDLYGVRKRDLTQRVMGLSSLYFPMYEEVLEREGLPLEFKYLSIVESALNPLAVSHCGATGLWQFMYNTGIMYNLSVTSQTDDRKDPYKSTVAACEYFKAMYKIYNDWLLVIASYNCGPGNVNKAIIRSGGKSDFWSISPYLPAETRGYVPAFIAVTYLLNHTAEHELAAISPSITYFETDTVNVFNRISFNALSNTLQIPVDVIAFLNPTYKKGYVPASINGKANTLRLPSNKVAGFIQNQSVMFEAESKLLAQRPEFKHLNKKLKYNTDENDWVTREVKKSHIVKRGETLNSIANRYNASTAEIKKLNKLRSNSVRQGQRLYVMAEQQVAVKKPKADTSNTTLANNDTSVKDSAKHLIDFIKGNVKANNATVATTVMHPNATDLPEGYLNRTIRKDDVVYHLVQKGDTLYGIAREQGISVQELMRYNGFSPNKKLKAGEKIKVKING
ncbi:MAG: LysM peptidoglycan-binding domain-containing protein [Bacteroidia bacterium]|nr:LysM peptidoglycan-binding domain-containing protein [Bacteroidia bacterium]